MTAFFDQLALVITYAGIVQGVFVTLLLTNKRVRGGRANRFLSVLLLGMSFSVLHNLFAGHVINHFAIRTYALGDPSFFLIAPLLWFYVLELTGHRIRLQFRTGLHFVPFVVAVFFSILLRHLPQTGGIANYLDAHTSWRSWLFWFCMVAQFSIYLYWVHNRWRVYQQQLVQEVSNTEHVTIGWVRYFMTIFLGITLFFLLILVNLIHRGPNLLNGYSVPVLFSLSIFALGYKGILQKEVFSVPISPDRVAQSPLSPPLAKPLPQQQIDQLLQYMTDQKPYLDPDLTLSSLAQRLSISRSQLSELINDGVGDNFYNFVNRYRVEQVKQFMADPTMKHFNLLGLALEAGFKSKSTFNLIFKRFTGQTPTEYMRGKTD